MPQFLKKKIAGLSPVWARWIGSGNKNHGHKSPRPVRLPYLDGLRAIACAQVMITHLLSCYFPGFVDGPEHAPTLASAVKNSPLFFLYDGFAGVFIFFYLSGYVLTRAFEESSERPLDIIQRRIVRLWPPTIFFGLFALGLYVIFGSYHAQLGPLLDSDQLTHCWKVSLEPNAVLKDIFAIPLFTGYQNSPLAEAFPFIFNAVNSSTAALNGPAWTMSVELQGSLLILALVLLWRRAKVFWIIGSVLGCLFMAPAFICFLVGHFAAVLRLAERPAVKERGKEFMMLALLAAGCLIAWPHRSGAYLALGVGLIFLGVIRSGICRRILGKPFLTRLGHLSFTIYLIHWGIIFGPGAWLMLKLIPLFGLLISRFMTAILVVGVTLFLARKFVVIDDLSVNLSRRVGKHSRSKGA